MLSDRDTIVEVLDHLDAVVDAVAGLSFDVLTTPGQLRVMEHPERVARKLPVPQHEVISRLAERASEAELGGRLPHALADRLPITRADAKRRVAEVADLGGWRTLTGETLPRS
jgi:Domain of unknown function (DUF222)